MAFAIIPLSMKSYVTATATSGDYTLYALKFVSNNEDEDIIEGVQAIYTAEDLQIPLISSQQAYGVYFNPIEVDGNYIFKAAYLGDKFTAVVSEDDTETLSGDTAMVFTNDNAEERLLPVVTAEDKGKTVVVNEDGKWELGEAGNATIILPTSKMGLTESKIVSAINALTNNTNYSSQTPVTITNADVKAQIDLLTVDNFTSSILKYKDSPQPIYFLPETCINYALSNEKIFTYKAVVNLMYNNLGKSEPLKIIYVSITKGGSASPYYYYANVEGVSFDLSSSHDAFTTPLNVYTLLMAKMNSLVTNATANNFAHDVVLVGTEADNDAFANDIKQITYMVSSGKTVVTKFGDMCGKPIHANYTEADNTHLYEFGVETFMANLNYYYRISLWYHSSSEDGIYIDMFAELMGRPSGD